MFNDMPPVLLLGICEKYNYSPLPVDKIYRTFAGHDIIGLRHSVTSSIFPISGNDFFLVFLVAENLPQSNYTILAENEQKKVIGTVKLDILEKPMNGCQEIVVSHQIKYHPMPVKIGGALLEPGKCNFYLSMDEKQFIGAINFYYKEAAPLTPEKINSIKSNPLSAKAVRFTFKCDKCGCSIGGYMDIDGRKEIEDDEFVWYQDLPDTFICTCRDVSMSLKYMKKNMHSLLGEEISTLSIEQDIKQSYNKSAYMNVVQSFKELVEKEATKSTGERTMQKFIEDNPFVLSLFAPELIKPQAPIGSKYVTDFAILNQKRELLLIEIEKPSTKLFRQQGGQHSEITRAFDQIDDWLMEADRNRLSVIDNLKMEGLSIDKVTNIKGIIIAGRSKDEDLKYMNKLLQRRQGVDFFTYDDVLQHLVITLRSIRGL